MSIEWRYGAVCGIDNCRSRLWHSVDGLSYCQNGHQRAGLGFEVAEDDYVSMQGQIIRRPRVLVEAKDENIFYGRRGYKLFLQCYQEIIQVQVRWLIDSKGVSKELDPIVKGLWLLYLDAQGINRLDLDLETEEEEVKRDETELYSDAEGDISEGVATNFADVPVHSDFVSFKLPDSVALCYLGLRILREPLFLCDLYRLVRSSDMPYFRAIHKVEYNLVRHLDLKYIRIFEPNFFPVPGSFQTAVRNVSTLLETKAQLDISTSQIPIATLTYKFVRELCLPIEIYEASRRLDELIGISKSISNVKSNHLKSQESLVFDELKILATVLFTTRLWFGKLIYSAPRTERPYIVSSKDFDITGVRIDWLKWKDNMIKLWLSEDRERCDNFTAVASKSGNKICERVGTKQNQLSGESILATEESDFQYDDDDVGFWDQSRMHRFMDFYERSYLITDPDQAEVVLPENHFLNLFPLDPHGRPHYAVGEDDFAMTQADDSNDVPTDDESEFASNANSEFDSTSLSESISKIIRALQATTFYEPDDSEMQNSSREYDLIQIGEFNSRQEEKGDSYGDRESDKIDVDNNNGNGKEARSSEDNDALDVLFSAASKIGGCSVEQIRRSLYVIERRCTSIMGKGKPNRGILR
ncbi:uncharacterized protein V1516DRAFT_676383 [Lipomyces oligophaga]|uniref:uncharacterized protein n=1 Tax=Lipomyces oligophaga TaxID=45792 RepID=UPI0034CF5FA3